MAVITNKNPDRRVTSHESDDFSDSYDDEYSDSEEYLTSSDGSKMSDDLAAKSMKTIKTVKTNRTGRTAKSRKRRVGGGPGAKAKKRLEHMPSSGPNIGLVGVGRNKAG